MTGNHPSPASRYGAPQPDAEPFPDDDWPDDGPGDPWPGSPQFQPGEPGGGPPPGKRTPWLPIALTAVPAGAAGVIIALLISGSPGTPSASTATPGGAPSAAAPAQGGTGNGISGGVSESLFMGGKVTAVTGHSITLSAEGHSVTATINSSTRFTGKVHSASGIKVGDLAAAQITGHGSDLVAVTIQDPAQLP
jgi:hypothetical protein